MMKAKYDFWSDEKLASAGNEARLYLRERCHDCFVKRAMTAIGDVDRLVLEAQACLLDELLSTEGSFSRDALDGLARRRPDDLFVLCSMDGDESLSVYLRQLILMRLNVKFWLLGDDSGDVAQYVTMRLLTKSGRPLVIKRILSVAPEERGRICLPYIYVAIRN